MTALEEIKKALEGVTPGPWKAVSEPHFDIGLVYTSIQPVNVDEEEMKPLAMANGEYHVCRMSHTAAPWRFNYHRRNAAYIAAVNPAAIAELLSTLESLQRENEASEATATRYANEIIELRGELAKTAALLVVQADRADAAEAELDSRNRELEEVETGMKRLRETLHPFAEAADYYSTGVRRTPAPDALPCGPALIVAHLRAARAALASTGGEHHAE